MKRILSSDEGDRISLGAPAPGLAVVKVDAHIEPSPWTVVLQSLQPGAALPVHRIRDWDEVWFVHKGQGKAMVAGAHTTVVPGASIHVPRNTWFGLKNTGTGVLQALVVAAPAGLDRLYRDLAALGSAPAADALQRVVSQHGIEISTDATPAEAPAEGGGRPRGRRRGRGRGRDRDRRQAQPQASAPAGPAEPSEPVSDAPIDTVTEPDQVVEAAPDAAPAQTQGQPAPGQGGGRRRRRRRGGRGRGRGGGQGGQPAGARSDTGLAPALRDPGSPGVVPQGRQQNAPAAQPASQPKPQGRRREGGRQGRPSAGGGGGGRREGRGGGRRFGRMKEVYMGGKWVRVSGDGPVISTGHEESPQPEDNE